MADLFLSYASEDREIARRFATALEASGWSVWWDRSRSSGIPAGQNFDEVIAQELETAKGVVVLWSSHSVESDWVIEEASFAKGDDRLFPVQVESGIELPFGFTRIQAPDLSAWSGDPGDPDYTRFADHVAAGLEHDPRSEDWLRSVGDRFLRRRRTRVGLSGLLLLPLVAAGIAAFVPVGSAPIRVEVDTRRAEFTLSAEAAVFPAMRGLELVYVGPLERVRLAAEVGAPEEHEADGEPLSAVLEVEDPARPLTLAQGVLGGGSGVGLSSQMGEYRVDLSTPASTALRVTAAGPVIADIGTEGLGGRSLELDPDLEPNDFTLRTAVDAPAALGFVPADGAEAVLFEDTPVESLRFAEVVRVRGDVDRTVVEGPIESGRLWFFPGGSADTVRLAAGDGLQFAAVSGSITRIAAGEGRFQAAFEGTVEGVDLMTSAAESNRAVSMPSMLRAAWSLWPTPLMAIAVLYTVLAGLLLRASLRR